MKIKPFDVPRSPQEHAAAVRAYLKHGRDQLQQEHRQGAPANAVARAHALLCEEVVAALYQVAVGGEHPSPPTPLPSEAQGDDEAGMPPVALLAMGGLGRLSLAPHADWDVTVVSDAPEHPKVVALVNRLFYPLWDAKVDVGHGVRGLQDFVRLIGEDDATLTAAADWRAIAGDPAMSRKLGHELQAALAPQRTRKYLRESVRLWLGDVHRATVYQLEPDVKHGPGGLREVHRLWWVARLGFGARSWDDVVQQGLLGASELSALMDGQETLLGIRLALHFLSGRRQDQLRFEYQDEVAAHLGMVAPSEQRAAADHLLETFYRHAKSVRTAARRLLERYDDVLHPPSKQELAKAAKGPQHLEGFAVVRGKLHTDLQQVQEHPLDLLRIFRVAQTSGFYISVDARATIAEQVAHLITAPLASQPKSARLLDEIMADPSDGGATLERMHELGVLEAFIPEFALVTGLVQRDLYHRYTVDAHLVACAARVQKLLAGIDTDAPEAIRNTAARISRPRVLVLAALLHDVGKGHGHGHSERGAVMIHEVALRLLWGEEDVADAVFLVREHLLMFKLALRRDLTDPHLMTQFCNTVESLERLDMLHVLSYADAITTGPEAWSNWKGTLLLELVHRATENLRQSGPPKTVVQRAQQQQEAAMALLSPEDAAAFATFAKRLRPRHVLGYRPSLLVRQWRTAAGLEGVGAQDQAACSIAQDDRRGGWEIIVVGHDRPGLLADLTAVLAAYGVSVQAAFISKTTDGAPIDTFVVSPGPLRALDDPTRRDALAQGLAAAAQTSVPQAVAQRLGERERVQKQRQPRGGLVPEIRVVHDAASSVEATVLDVFAPDRPGLLHHLARSLFETRVSIVLARINTEGGRVADAFYLVEADTGRPLTAKRRGTVIAALRAACATETSTENDGEG